MLSYLSKFVLQMLPTISATVIGAYIVATWINPKTPPDPAKMTAQAEKAAKGASAAGHAPVASEVARPEDSDEDARAVKAANAPDRVRIIPIVRQPPSNGVSSSTGAVETAPAADDRKDVNEIARAATLRLRGDTEPGRVADEPVKSASTQRHQQPRAPAEAPQAAAPPLPPAISIVSPRYPHAEVEDSVSAGPPDRLTPPGEVPAPGSSLNLQASHRIVGNPSPADDFLLATKSFFRAITPH